MLQALYNFFLPLFELELDGGDYLWDIGVNLNTGNGNTYTMYMDSYFAMLCSIISLSIIVILCCLFIYRIIKLVGGLIR